MRSGEQTCGVLDGVCEAIGSKARAWEFKADKFWRIRVASDDFLRWIRNRDSRSVGKAVWILRTFSNKVTGFRCMEDDEAGSFTG